MKGKLLVTLQFILLFALALLPGSKDSSQLRSVLAALLALLAVFILFRAFRDLGSALTPLPESKEGAELVTSGIYSYLRHPIYSARSSCLSLETKWQCFNCSPAINFPVAI
jgi:protein-S-isoprenylcysteine O-methyltransferase Ste14